MSLPEPQPSQVQSTQQLTQPSTHDATPRRDSARPELRVLTILRGFAALWVVAYHLREYIPVVAPAVWAQVKPFVRSGYLGVDLFFVLSGFVIAYTYYDSMQPFALATYLRFVRKRFARIYPAYVVMVCVTSGKHFWQLATASDTAGADWWPSVQYLVDQLLMLQGWQYPIVRMWNVISWSVSVEWLAYLLFPQVVFVAATLRSRRTMLGLGVCYAILGGLTLQALDDGGNMRLGLFRILFAFPLGVLSYRLYALDRTPSRRWGYVGIALLLGFGPLSRLLLGPLRLDGMLLAPAIFPLIVYGLSRADFAWSGHRTLLWLGHISYCLYLVHVEAMRAVRRLLAPELVARFGTGVGLVYLAVTVAVAIGCAHALHVWVERPWRTRLLGTAPACAATEHAVSS